MVIVISLTLLVAVTGAVHRALLKAGKAAVPIMAGIMALLLGIAGFVRLALSLHFSGSSSYWIVSRGFFLGNFATFYVVAAVLALLTWKLANDWIRRLLAPAFWSFHLGAGAAVLLTLLWDQSQQYVDFPDAIYWQSMMWKYAIHLNLLGLFSLFILAIVALGQSAYRRWKHSR
jgi:hypothetical protein